MVLQGDNEPSFLSGLCLRKVIVCGTCTLLRLLNQHRQYEAPAAAVTNNGNSNQQKSVMTDLKPESQF